jgi:CTP synthase
LNLFFVNVTDATSEEFTPNVEKPVIVFMPEISKTHMGGTMRLGLRPTVFEPGTKQSIARQLYAGAPTIWERHDAVIVIDTKRTPL